VTSDGGPVVLRTEAARAAKSLETKSDFLAAQYPGGGGMVTFGAMLGGGPQKSGGSSTIDGFVVSFLSLDFLLFLSSLLFFWWKCWRWLR